MYKKILNILFLVFVAAATSFLFQTTSKAQGTSFQSVIPFVNNMGYFGFFDQNTGMVYLYDGNIQNCVLTVQLTKLGEPAKVVKPFVQPIPQEGEFYMDTKQKGSY